MEKFIDGWILLFAIIVAILSPLIGIYIAEKNFESVVVEFVCIEYVEGGGELE